MNVTGWLVDTVTVARRVGRDSYGDPTYSASEAIKARVEPDVAIVIGVDGTERESSHKFVTDVELEQGDKVWLPGADTTDDGAAKRVIGLKGAAVKDGSQSLYEVRV